MTCDLCTLIYLLESSLGCKRMHAIGEQQSKRTQSGAATEADASGEHAAAAEAGAIGEQQLEADANGEQQLKQMQSGQGAAADSKQMQAASSS